MSNDSIEKNLRNLLLKKKLEPYIRHIRFPHYKNLAPDTHIEFTYPITAFVGANGTNKSSVIRALYGSPGQNNLGNYWFSTSIDPIQEADGDRNRFIYGYLNQGENKTVEVIKTRIHNEDDPDYWEPSRPLKKDGMEKMPPLPAGEKPIGRSETRWHPIDKNVEYLDFRADLSAYDKLFYHGELRYQPSTIKNKKTFIRSRSGTLKHAIQSKASSYPYYGVERVVANVNRMLTPEELSAVSNILGRSYSEISLIRHKFFNCDAYTSIMKVGGLNYSEAFAGSGEFAVVRLVVGIMSAPESSLILLDEPEVSLHPGAQGKLMAFLAEIVKLKKHQVVISTHSPAIIRCLPPDAIKVFAMGLDGKVVIPSQSSLSEEAFFHLGEPVQNKVTVVVEDVLAAEIVRRALRIAGEAASNLFAIRHFSGGSQTLWGHYIPAFAAENRTDVLVLFDGDQRPEEDFPDPDTISTADGGSIRQLIIKVTGVDVSFNIDSGNDESKTKQRDEMQREYIKWVRERVAYLPGSSSPEAFLWENMKKGSHSKTMNAGNAKECFVMLTKKLLGLADYEHVSADDILATQRRKLATISDNHPELVKLKERLLATSQSRSE